MKDEQIFANIEEAKSRIHFWTPEHGATVQSLLRANSGNLPDEKEIERALPFYRGDQWDKDTLDTRLAHQRPCITINHMPVVVASFLAKSEPVSDADLKTFIALVVRYNDDAQRLLNYLSSCQAELAPKLQPHEHP